jgi:hypothetical protein
VNSPAPSVRKPFIASLVVLTSVALILVLALAASRSSAAEASGPPAVHGIEAVVIHSTRAQVNADSIEPDGTTTQWRIEYATNEGGPWTFAQGGTTEPPSDGRGASATIHHLIPQTIYYVRIIAENASGTSEATNHFITLPISSPEIPEHHCTVTVADTRPVCVAQRVTSALIEAEVQTNGAETEFSLEYATVEGGPYTPISGGGGTVSAVEDYATPEVLLTGLAAETLYYIRAVATNSKGSEETLRKFETLPAKPRVGGGGVSDVTATSAKIEAAVSPDGADTNWQFETAGDEGGPWSVAAGASGLIHATEAEIEYEPVTGELTGLAPATTYYIRVAAENGSGHVVGDVLSFETAGPPIVRTSATWVIDGQAPRVLGTVTPHGFDTHYHFEYVTEQHFEAEGFANPLTTPQSDAGGGSGEDSGSYEAKVVAADIGGAEPGQTYRFRLLAGSSAPAGSLVEGEERTLEAPQGPPPPPASCPNEAFRTGPSARLLDCRAYEQVTPAQKSTQDLFGNAGVVDGLTPAGDGERVALQTIAQLGDVSGSQASPGGRGASISYVISREGSGWQLRSIYPSNAGHTGYFGEIFSPDLDQVGVQATNFNTFFEYTGGLDMLAGPAAGPYVPVAENVAIDESLLRSNGTDGTSFAGADANFSHIVFASNDRSLAAGAGASVTHAPNLFEFSNGEITLLNVRTDGTLVDTCGATLGYGSGVEGDFAHNAVSDSGAVVFFTAPAINNLGATGSSCEEPPQLYMRRGGETIEISAAQGIVDPAGPQPVRYQGASADGKMVFFATTAELTSDDQGIHDEELYEYNTDSGELTRISHGVSGTAAAEVIGQSGGHHMAISENGLAVYFQAAKPLTSDAPHNPVGGAIDIYRYDTATGETTYVATIEKPMVNGTDEATPNGRFLLFEASHVLGVEAPVGEQLYRYDSAQRSLTCVSCVRSIPGSVNMPNVGETGSPSVATMDEVPGVRAISDDGSYAFFATTAALLPRDVNEALDVYEWHEGAVSLLSDGRSPHGSELFGEAADGRDVFVSSHEQLSPWDNDQQGDAYDARIDGGFAPPPPAEAPCEGDACHNPTAPPAEPTLSTSVASGPGNPTPHSPAHRKHKHGKAKQPVHQVPGHKHAAKHSHRRTDADPGGEK